MVILTLYSVVMLPIPAFFDPSIAGDISVMTMDYIIDVIFVTDLILTFFTAYTDDWGKIICDRKVFIASFHLQADEALLQKIRDRYLFSIEFALDLLSNVPVEIIGPAFGINRGSRKLALLRCGFVMCLSKPGAEPVSFSCSQSVSCGACAPPADQRAAAVVLRLSLRTGSAPSSGAFPPSRM
jgi:hypothetical protein